MAHHRDRSKIDSCDAISNQFNSLCLKKASKNCFYEDYVLLRNQLLLLEYRKDDSSVASKLHKISDLILRFIEDAPKPILQTVEFVKDVHRKILFLYGSIPADTKESRKFKDSQELQNLLVRYVELEHEVLFTSWNHSAQYQKQAEERILALLLSIFEDTKNQREVCEVEKTAEQCAMNSLYVISKVKKAYSKQHNFIENVMIKLLKHLNILDKFSEMKNKRSTFFVDKFLQIPKVQKVYEYLHNRECSLECLNTSDDEIEEIVEHIEIPVKNESTCKQEEKVDVSSFTCKNGRRKVMTIDLVDDDDDVSMVYFEAEAQKECKTDTKTVFGDFHLEIPQRTLSNITNRFDKYVQRNSITTSTTCDEKLFNKESCVVSSSSSNSVVVIDDESDDEVEVVSLVTPKNGMKSDLILPSGNNQESLKTQEVQPSPPPPRSYMELEDALLQCDDISDTEIEDEDEILNRFSDEKDKNNANEGNKCNKTDVEKTEKDTASLLLENINSGGICDSNTSQEITTKSLSKSFSQNQIELAVTVENTESDKSKTRQELNEQLNIVGGNTTKADRDTRSDKNDILNEVTLNAGGPPLNELNNEKQTGGAVDGEKQIETAKLIAENIIINQEEVVDCYTPPVNDQHILEENYKETCDLSVNNYIKSHAIVETEPTVENINNVEVIDDVASLESAITESLNLTQKTNQENTEVYHDDSQDQPIPDKVEESHVVAGEDNEVIEEENQFIEEHHLEPIDSEHLVVNSEVEIEHFTTYVVKKHAEITVDATNLNKPQQTSKELAQVEECTTDENESSTVEEHHLEPVNLEHLVVNSEVEIEHFTTNVVEKYAEITVDATDLSKPQETSKESPQVKECTTEENESSTVEEHHLEPVNLEHLVVNSEVEIEHFTTNAVEKYAEITVDATDLSKPQETSKESPQAEECTTEENESSAVEEHHLEPVNLEHLVVNSEVEIQHFTTNVVEKYAEIAVDATDINKLQETSKASPQAEECIIEENKSSVVDEEHHLEPVNAEHLVVNSEVEIEHFTTNAVEKYAEITVDATDLNEPQEFSKESPQAEECTTEENESSTVEEHHLEPIDSEHLVVNSEVEIEHFTTNVVGKYAETAVDAIDINKPQETSKESLQAEEYITEENENSTVVSNISPEENSLATTDLNKSQEISQELPQVEECVTEVKSTIVLSSILPEENNAHAIIDLNKPEKVSEEAPQAEEYTTEETKSSSVCSVIPTEENSSSAATNLNKSQAVSNEIPQIQTEECITEDVHPEESNLPAITDLHKPQEVSKELPETQIEENSNEENESSTVLSNITPPEGTGQEDINSDYVNETEVIIEAVAEAVYVDTINIPCTVEETVQTTAIENLVTTSPEDLRSVGANDKNENDLISNDLQKQSVHSIENTAIENQTNETFQNNECIYPNTTTEISKQKQPGIVVSTMIPYKSQSSHSSCDDMKEYTEHACSNNLDFLASVAVTQEKMENSLPVKQTRGKRGKKVAKAKKIVEKTKKKVAKQVEAETKLKKEVEVIPRRVTRSSIAQMSYSKATRDNAKCIPSTFMNLENLVTPTPNKIYNLIPDNIVEDESLDEPFNCLNCETQQLRENTEKYTEEMSCEIAQEIVISSVEIETENDDVSCKTRDPIFDENTVEDGIFLIGHKKENIIEDSVISIPETVQDFPGINYDILKQAEEFAVEHVDKNAADVVKVKKNNKDEEKDSCSITEIQENSCNDGSMNSKETEVVIKNKSKSQERSKITSEAEKEEVQKTVKPCEEISVHNAVEPTKPKESVEMKVLKEYDVHADGETYFHQEDKKPTADRPTFIMPVKKRRNYGKKNIIINKYEMKAAEENEANILEKCETNKQVVENNEAIVFSKIISEAVTPLVTSSFEETSAGTAAASEENTTPFTKEGLCESNKTATKESEAHDISTVTDLEKSTAYENSEVVHVSQEISLEASNESSLKDSIEEVTTISEFKQNNDNFVENRLPIQVTAVLEDAQEAQDNDTQTKDETQNQSQQCHTILKEPVQQPKVQIINEVTEENCNAIVEKEVPVESNKNNIESFPILAAYEIEAFSEEIIEYSNEVEKQKQTSVEVREEEIPQTPEASPHDHKSVNEEQKPLIFEETSKNIHIKDSEKSPVEETRRVLTKAALKTFPIPYVHLQKLPDNFNYKEKPFEQPKPKIIQTRSKSQDATVKREKRDRRALSECKYRTRQSNRYGCSQQPLPAKVEKAKVERESKQKTVNLSLTKEGNMSKDTQGDVKMKAENRKQPEKEKPDESLKGEKDGKPNSKTKSNENAEKKNTETKSRQPKNFQYLELFSLEDCKITYNHKSKNSQKKEEKRIIAKAKLKTNKQKEEMMKTHDIKDEKSKNDNKIYDVSQEENNISETEEKSKDSQQLNKKKFSNPNEKDKTDENISEVLNLSSKNKEEAVEDNNKKSNKGRNSNKSKERPKLKENSVERKKATDSIKLKHEKSETKSRHKEKHDTEAPSHLEYKRRRSSRSSSRSDDNAWFEKNLVERKRTRTETDKETTRNQEPGQKESKENRQQEQQKMKTNKETVRNEEPEQKEDAESEEPKQQKVQTHNATFENLQSNQSDTENREPQQQELKTDNETCTKVDSLLIFDVENAKKTDQTVVVDAAEENLDFTADTGPIDLSSKRKTKTRARKVQRKRILSEEHECGYNMEMYNKKFLLEQEYQEKLSNTNHQSEELDLSNNRSSEDNQTNTNAFESNKDVLDISGYNESTINKKAEQMSDATCGIENDDVLQDSNLENSLIVESSISEEIIQKDMAVEGKEMEVPQSNRDLPDNDIDSESLGIYETSVSEPAEENVDVLIDTKQNAEICTDTAHTTPVTEHAEENLEIETETAYETPTVEDTEEISRTDTSHATLATEHAEENLEIETETAYETPMVEHTEKIIRTDTVCATPVTENEEDIEVETETAFETPTEVIHTDTARATPVAERAGENVEVETETVFETPAVEHMEVIHTDTARATPVVKHAGENVEVETETVFETPAVEHMEVIHTDTACATPVVKHAGENVQVETETVFETSAVEHMEVIHTDTACATLVVKHAGENVLFETPAVEHMEQIHTDIAHATPATEYAEGNAEVQTETACETATIEHMEVIHTDTARATPATEYAEENVEVQTETACETSTVEPIEENLEVQTVYEAESNTEHLVNLSNSKSAQNNNRSEQIINIEDEDTYHQQEMMQTDDSELQPTVFAKIDTSQDLGSTNKPEEKSEKQEVKKKERIDFIIENLKHRNSQKLQAQEAEESLQRVGENISLPDLPSTIYYEAKTDQPMENENVTTVENVKEIISENLQPNEQNAILQDTPPPDTEETLLKNDECPLIPVSVTEISEVAAAAPVDSINSIKNSETESVANTKHDSIINSDIPDSAAFSSMNVETSTQEIHKSECCEENLPEIPQAVNIISNSDTNKDKNLIHPEENFDILSKTLELQVDKSSESHKLNENHELLNVVTNLETTSAISEDYLRKENYAPDILTENVTELQRNVNHYIDMVPISSYPKSNSVDSHSVQTSSIQSITDLSVPSSVPTLLPLAETSVPLLDVDKQSQDVIVSMATSSTETSTACETDNLIAVIFSNVALCSNTEVISYSQQSRSNKTGFIYFRGSDHNYHSVGDPLLSGKCDTSKNDNSPESSKEVTTPEGDPLLSGKCDISKSGRSSENIEKVPIPEGDPLLGDKCNSNEGDSSSENGKDIPTCELENELVDDNILPYITPLTVDSSSDFQLLEQCLINNTLTRDASPPLPQSCDDTLCHTSLKEEVLTYDDSSTPSNIEFANDNSESFIDRFQQQPMTAENMSELMNAVLTGIQNLNNMTRPTQQHDSGKENLFQSQSVTSDFNTGADALATSINSSASENVESNCNFMSVQVPNLCLQPDTPTTECSNISFVNDLHEPVTFETDFANFYHLSHETSLNNSNKKVIVERIPQYTDQQINSLIDVENSTFATSTTASITSPISTNVLHPPSISPPKHQEKRLNINKVPYVSLAKPILRPNLEAVKLSANKDLPASAATVNVSLGFIRTSSRTRVSAPRPKKLAERKNTDVKESESSTNEDGSGTESESGKIDIPVLKLKVRDDLCIAAHKTLKEAVLKRAKEEDTRNKRSLRVSAEENHGDVKASKVEDDNKTRLEMPKLVKQKEKEELTKVKTPGRSPRTDEDKAPKRLKQARPNSTDKLRVEQPKDGNKDDHVPNTVNSSSLDDIQKSETEINIVHGDMIDNVKRRKRKPVDYIEIERVDYSSIDKLLGYENAKPQKNKPRKEEAEESKSKKRKQELDEKQKSKSPPQKSSQEINKNTVNASGADSEFAVKRKSSIFEDSDDDVPKKKKSTEEKPNPEDMDDLFDRLVKEGNVNNVKTTPTNRNSDAEPSPPGDINKEFHKPQPSARTLSNIFNTESRLNKKDATTPAKQVGVVTPIPRPPNVVRKELPPNWNNFNNGGASRSNQHYPYPERRHSSYSHSSSRSSHQSHQGSSSRRMEYHHSTDTRHSSSQRSSSSGRSSRSNSTASGRHHSTSRSSTERHSASRLSSEQRSYSRQADRYSSSAPSDLSWREELKKKLPYMFNDEVYF